MPLSIRGGVPYTIEGVYPLLVQVYFLIPTQKGPDIRNWTPQEGPGTRDWVPPVRDLGLETEVPPPPPVDRQTPVKT